jgi:hypothetical protein
VRYPNCVGHPGGSPCGVEVDALSYGTDPRFLVGPPAARLFFSVEERAIGHPSSVLVPSVRSEAASGVREAGSDVFTTLPLPVGPLPPGASPPENIAVIDGNGLVSGSGARYRGIGLVEPNPPSVPPDLGDNLDALSIGPVPGPTGFVYYSLDSCFVDPETGVQNSCSAQFQNVPPGAVLRRQISGGPVTVYATPSQLGLDLLGLGTDDLDALVLWDNGDGVFQPSQNPYDWANGTHDMLLFSVRRGSLVIGQPDSIFGLPIEPGDILTAPQTALIGSTPGIFIGAENLGLSTARSGGHADEVDGIAVDDEPYYDCNGNGVEDSVEIATGATPDANNNGIPDECEQGWSGYCYCPSPVAPCGNDDATAGCKNSTGVGGLFGASGTTSFVADDLVLTATQLPTNKLGLFLLSAFQAQTVLGDGLRCVGNPLRRFGSFDSGPTGSAVKGPGVISQSCSTLPAAYCITLGSTWNFQVWHRNPTGPCGGGTNLTNAMEVPITP